MDVAPSTNNTAPTSVIHFPSLVPLLEVADAIEAKDDAGLLRLARKAPNRDEFLETVRLCSGNVSIAVDPDRSVFHHATMWVMPVVTYPGHARHMHAPNEVILEAIHTHLTDWVGPELELSTLMAVPSYGAFSGMTPAGIRSLCERLFAFNLTGQRKVSAQVSESEHEVQLPLLSFMAGIIKQPVRLPGIPNHDTPAGLRAFKRVDEVLAFQCENTSMDRSLSHEMRLPLSLSDGLSEGVCMWIDALARNSEILAWDIEHLPTSYGRMDLHILVQHSQGEGERQLLKVPLSRWQLGAGGIERVLQSLRQYRILSGMTAGALNHALEETRWAAARKHN